MSRPFSARGEQDNFPGRLRAEYRAGGGEDGGDVVGAEDGGDGGELRAGGSVGG